MEPEKAEEFYRRLKEQLDIDTEWPTTYLYKFIVPSDADKINEIQNIFDNEGAVIESKKSKKGNYTSISITVTMPDADAIIKKYRRVGKVKGVISL